MLFGKLAVVCGSTVDVTDLLIENVAVMFGRLCSGVIVDDIFTEASTVKVCDDTSLEFDAVIVFVADAVAVTPRLRAEKVVDTAVIAVLDINTMFEEFISAVEDL